MPLNNPQSSFEDSIFGPNGTHPRLAAMSTKLRLFFIVCVIGAIMIAADMIYVTLSAAEGISASCEVGFDRNYRQYDAVFPRIRESFFERVESPDERREIEALIEDFYSCWDELKSHAFRRFRAEYPEDDVSDKTLRAALQSIWIRHESGTRILTVTATFGDQCLSERLAGTFARSLANLVGEKSSRDAARDLAPLREQVKAKEKVRNDLRGTIEKNREVEKGEGLAQPAEYVRQSRLLSEKIIPEYNKLVNQEKDKARTLELDRLVAFVLGPARPPEQVESEARKLCQKAEKRAVAQAERQRRDWNDRWEDRLEQIHLRKESPRRKYLFPAPDDRRSRFSLPDYCDNDIAVDTNSALHGFLGCPFGERSIDKEHYVRLDQPFEGFPWVRYDTCRTCQKVSRCDARLTFRTTGLSEVPFRRMLRIRDVFHGRYGLDFAEERRGEDYFAEAYAQPGYRVGLFVTNALVKVGDDAQIEYTLGFEVVNEQVLPLVARRMQDPACNWHNVLHVTTVPQAMRNDESAWAYLVVKGRSTEELIDEFIRTGDRKILELGGGELGTPVGWSRGGSASGYFAQQPGGENEGYMCQEWEADLFLAFVRSFVKICDPETKQRLYLKRCNPDMFRRREKGKTGVFTVGQIYCDLIPGDRVTWYTDRSRKTGTVCEDGEGGEYWDCIKKTMKDVETLEKATEEDWRPTPLTEEFRRRHEEIGRRSYKIRNTMYVYSRHLVDVDFAADTNLVAAVNFLNECLGERQPGVYVAPHMEHILDLRYPTRALVRRKKRHQENLSRSDFLSDLERARNDILDAFFQDTALSNGVPDSAAKAFRLSRYECAKYGIKRLAFLKLEPRRSNYMVIPVHHPVDEPPRVFSSDEVAKAKRDLVPLENRLVDFALEDEEGRMKTDCGDVVLLIYEILHSAFSSQAGNAAVADLLPLCRRIVAANLHQSPMYWIVWRTTLEFHDDPAVWKFAEDVVAEVERLDGISFVHGRSQAKKNLEEWLKSDLAKTWRRQ